jgi:hypothetical protein
MEVTSLPGYKAMWFEQNPIFLKNISLHSSGFKSKLNGKSIRAKVDRISGGP